MVEAVVHRQEPIHKVARIFNVSQRTIFDCLAWFRAKGWSPRRPLYQIYRKDQERVNAYPTATFPEAAAKAKQLNARMFFVDESAIRSGACRGTTWSPVGATPVVKYSGGRFGMSLISAISRRGDLRLSVIGETRDASRFIAVLKRVYRDTGGPILVVAQNAVYQHSSATRRFIEEQNGQIQLVYLPPYSPELNPEQVRNHATRDLGTRAILSRPALGQRVFSFLRSLQKQSDRVRSLFRLPDTRYILGALK